MATETKQSRPAAQSPAAESVPQYQAAMPQIPGVDEKRRAASKAISKRVLVVGGAGIAVVILGFAWFVTRRNSGPQTDSANTAMVAETPVADLPPVPPPTHALDEIATTDELRAAWSSKEFTYRRPFSGDKLQAIVIRLPGGSDQQPLFWGIELQAPYNHCDLKFVTDLSVLALQYGFNAAHPMIVDTCNGSIFDPLKMGTLGDGSWTRGELVKGGDLRPPLAVEIKVEGNRVVAGRAEQ